MSRFQGAAVRLVDGSGLLARHLADRAVAWIRAGRREDLTGIPALLGVLLRMVIVGVGLWALWRLVRAVPNLMWLITTVWCWCAARATRPSKDAVADPSAAEDDAAPDPAAVRTLLFEVLGDRPAVHLSTVLKHLQENGHHPGWTVTDLRVRLEALGIPHDRRVKVGRIPTWGVRRRDLEAPSPDDAPGPSPTSSTAA